ncbi:MAG: hypothetical protein ACTTJL_04025 [Hoylesella enoeca]|uniref:hypothetical protein n=1 Tax=Hoylesella enoeca TaxID=76123 RepID=UPI003FA18076
MTKIRNILFASLAAVFLSSCGEQYKAKQLVSNFLDRSLAEKDFSIENCSKLDSTYYVTDSTLNAMRAASRKDAPFIRARYEGVKRSKKLLFIRIDYTNNGRKHTQTFYMDDRLQHVVAFKNN